MKLTTSNATVTNTVVSSKLTIGNNAVVESLTVGNVSINSSAIAVGNVSITPAVVSTPSLILGGASFAGGTFGGIVDYQEFAANGTWYNPLVNAAANAYLTGYEQVFVMAWGGGGGGGTNTTAGSAGAGGGGACALGTFLLSSATNTCAVTVGGGGSVGAPNPGGNGGNSIFVINSSATLIAYGGTGGSNTAGGLGGGTLPSSGPLGNSSSNGVSTYGGGGFNTLGYTIFGGGGGAFGAAGVSVPGGSSIYGGGGGSKGGNTTYNVRVWVIGPGSTTAGAPTYTLTANTTTLYEGSSVLYTVSTTNVANNTTLYYTLNNSSSATSADFTTAVNGSVVISGGTGTFTLTANNDADSANEAFQIDVRTGSTTGSIVASNGSVSIVPFVGGDITVVSTSAAQTSVGSSVSLNMPSGIQQDDLVIISHLVETQPIVPSGWTEITFTPASVTSFKAFYKFMGSTPDTSVTLQASGGATSIASVALALRNANTSPLDGTATSTAVNVNDPAAITTSKANSYVIIVGFGYGGFGSITNASGYTQANTIGNGVEGLMVSYKKVLTPSTENPPTFSISADDSSTVTFAIKNNLV
jgi:hypothetical protein